MVGDQIDMTDAPSKGGTLEITIDRPFPDEAEGMWGAAWRLTVDYPFLDEVLRNPRRREELF